MISVTSYFMEAAETGKKYTRADVGSGIGKVTGGALASLPGVVAGHYIGKAVVNDPDKPADLSKKSHRYGILTTERLNAKRIGKGLGIGAAVGAGLAGVNAVMNPDVDVADNISSGALGGGLIGVNVGQMVGGYKGAKNIGYGHVGKTFGALSSFTGLAKPRGQK